MTCKPGNKALNMASRELQPPDDIGAAYFLSIPRNIFSFEVSSGDFSAAPRALFVEDSEVDEGTVEASEASYWAPEDAEAILITIRKKLYAVIRRWPPRNLVAREVEFAAGSWLFGFLENDDTRDKTD